MQEAADVSGVCVEGKIEEELAAAAAAPLLYMCDNCAL